MLVYNNNIKTTTNNLVVSHKKVVKRSRSKKLSLSSENKNFLKSIGLTLKNKN